MANAFHIKAAAWAVKYWPNIATLVVILAVIGFTYHTNERNREITVCHTNAMDDLHKSLYARLGEHPKQPAVWGPEWVDAFAAWQTQMGKCPG